MRLVEFVGAPGAGKSSIARQIHRMTPAWDARVLRNQVLSQRSFLERLFWLKSKALSGFIKPIVYGRLVSRLDRVEPYYTDGFLGKYVDSIYAHSSHVRQARIRHAMLLESLLIHVAGRAHASPITAILEEGMAQRGLSGVLTGLPAELVDEHYSAIPMADLYVFVTVPQSTLRERLLLREGSDAKLVSVDAVHQARRALLARSARVLEVDGTAKVEENARFIVARYSASHRLD